MNLRGAAGDVDTAAALTAASEALGAECERCDSSAPAAAAEMLLRLQSRRCAVIVIALPSAGAHEALTSASGAWRQHEHARVLLLGSAAQIADLGHGLSLGAREICVLPAYPGELAVRLERLIAHDLTEDVDVRALKEKLGLQQIVGHSPEMIEILQRLPTQARSGATLLIRGETGTGKEVFARAVHYLSERSQCTFVSVNCGAIPTELLENELFGHAAGAFTGAAGAREGLVAEASGGTLFLDEVDALPLSAQVKVLRLLQEKEYRPIGSARSRQADIRIVAASNANLDQALAEGRFRRDLFYRLDVLSIRLPPLRERLDDLLLLAEHFLARFRDQYQKPGLELTQRARQRLLAHDWPGNVRQLENVLERAAILCPSGCIDFEHIETPETSASEPFVGFQQAKANVVRRFEREYLERLLALHQGNIAHAARTAGKNRRALFELIRKHGISAQAFCAER